MLVVDASCLGEVLVAGPGAEAIRDRFELDGEHAAPHVVDVEVFGIIRRGYLRGRLDPTAASQAVEDLEGWPAERYGHRPLLARAWELRQSVRGWDALYVALDVPLLTTDRRLAAAPGPTCRIELVSPAGGMPAER